MPIEICGKGDLALEPHRDDRTSNQGLVDLAYAAVTQPYLRATATQTDSSEMLTPDAKFMSNPASAAIVDAVGAFRSAQDGRAAGVRSWLFGASELEGKQGQAFAGFALTRLTALQPL